MKYQPIKFDHLFGTPGFSDQLLKTHFSLYEGYVTNTNKLDKIICDFDQAGNPPTPEYSETKRRFGWEFNGMRLHEYYFGNMKKNGSQEKSQELTQAFSQHFGSYKAWETSFRNTGIIRGIGWVILSYDPAGNYLYNIWVNEHHEGLLGGNAPILVMDVFEHAYITDYGLKRDEYMNAFFAALDWKVISDRFKDATAKRK